MSIVCRLLAGNFEAFEYLILKQMVTALLFWFIIFLFYKILKLSVFLFKSQI